MYSNNFTNLLAKIQQFGEGIRKEKYNFGIYQNQFDSEELVNNITEGVYYTVSLTGREATVLFRIGLNKNKGLDKLDSLLKKINSEFGSVGSSYTCLETSGFQIVSLELKIILC